MGKSAYPAQKALETVNTLLDGGISAKAHRTIVLWQSTFSTGSGAGYNQHKFNCPFLVDNDKPKKNLLLGLAITFVQS